MSLDVYLTLPGEKSENTGFSGIFVREDGQTKEISRAEWDEKFPGREPIVIEVDDEDDRVYSANITHNLGRMAAEAGIYKHLWRPDEIHIENASQLVEPLRQGLLRLEADPDHFKEFNPSNGWGDYDALVDFVRDYLAACEEYPQADVSVWR